MSVGKIFNFTRRLTSFPRTITSFFDLARKDGETYTQSPNFAQRNFSSDESSGLFPSLKSYSKRVRFYDRSEPEEGLMNSE